LSFILTAVILAGTAICGFMPGFYYNVAMCFIMGLGAGGVLPVVYTLLAETMPARHRGWLSVVIGGVGGLCGYLLASTTAFLLEPLYSWRILWLPNLPTSLFILLMGHWIPESPRYLMQIGFHDMARQAIQQVGLAIGTVDDNLSSASPDRQRARRRRAREVFSGSLRTTTLLLCLYGFAWGLCNWGFLTWLPTILRSAGYNAQFTSGLLAKAALFALPGSLVAAGLYGLWSPKHAAALFALGTGGVLLLIGVGQSVIAGNGGLITAMIVALLITSSSMLGILAPYSTELYPTDLRGAGSGVVAASSKVAGVVGPVLIGTLLTITSGPVLPALVVSVPLGGVGLAIALCGAETRGRTLEELSQQGN